MAGARTLAFFWAATMAAHAGAQTFAKVTDVANPIATSGGPAAQYGGASWVDPDDDGDDDLYVNGVGLFRNDGAGAFVHLPAAVPSLVTPFGNTWADIDNDGDLDVFLSGGGPTGSALCINQGNLVFTKVLAGAIANTAENRAWGCAFGDYDSDGFVDLVTAAANGFAGIANPNRLYHNDGTGTFARIDTTSVAQTLGPFTIPTWSDFDFDGDPDLFIGAGPADGTVARDYLYRNRLEVAPHWLQRIDEAPLGTDLQDGQIYNWIDYDNDGDLDAHLTNYLGPLGGMVDRLYRNDGGAFVSVPAAQAGAIVADAFMSLASVWQDFDNDGDVDCLVTQDGSHITRFYRNNGNGGFTSVAVAGLTTAGPRYGAAAGDYDADGRMDLFVAGTATTFGLFRNTTANANNWLQVRLVGTTSNRAAIGARVRVRAVIGGVPRWQLRELSAQNSFNGMSSLDAHFGLASASEADSVVVEWPSGSVSVRTAITAGQRILVVEEDATAAGGGLDAPGFGLLAVSPNPGPGPRSVRFALAGREPAVLEVFDVAGRRLLRMPVRAPAPGMHVASLPALEHVASGVYFVHLQQGARRDARRVVVLHD